MTTALRERVMKVPLPTYIKKDLTEMKNILFDNSYPSKDINRILLSYRHRNNNIKSSLSTVGNATISSLCNMYKHIKI